MKPTVRPFTVRWNEDDKARVLRQVRDYVFPPAPKNAGWSLGADAGFLGRLREYWLDQFDWAKAADYLNRYPQFIAEIDGTPVHFAHIAAERPGAPALLLMHGWPSAYFEFWQVVDRLTHPSRHGGNADDSVDLVVPSLPGYAFSGLPDRIIGPWAVASIIHRLMTEHLGYSQYLSHGGDWGAIVTSCLADAYPDNVQAIHLAMIALPPPQVYENEEEADIWARYATIQQDLGGYSHLQASKPQSLAWLAAGNPMGQIAWIAERLHDWSDLRERAFEDVFDPDWIITLALCYIMPESFRTAAYLYHGRMLESGSAMMAHSGQARKVPTAFTAHPGDPRVTVPLRKRVAEYYNLVRWVEAKQGGHFPAVETPDHFATDLIEWLGCVRGQDPDR